jgi:hypothetical protein
MALSSPGVQVSVIDESFYTPAEPGTVPLIIVASEENKSNQNKNKEKHKNNAFWPFFV